MLLNSFIKTALFVVLNFLITFVCDVIFSLICYALDDPLIYFNSLSIVCYFNLHKCEILKAYKKQFMGFIMEINVIGK